MSRSMAAQQRIGPMREIFSKALFRYAWFASVLSFSAALICEFSAVWTLSSMTTRADLVALAQSATYVSLMIFALPSSFLVVLGTHRALLIAAQIVSALAVAGMLLTLSRGGIAPNTMLAFCFILGAAAALSVTMWQISAAELTAPQHSGSAVALLMTSYNISRLISPAIASLIIVIGGVASAFSLGLFLFLGAMALLFFVSWPSNSTPKPPTNGFATAFKFMTRSALLHRLILTGFLFAFFASSIWVLLPLIARLRLGAEVSNFGLITASLGVGGIAVTPIILRLRRHLSANGLLSGSSVGLAVCGQLLDRCEALLASCLVAIFFGGAWIMATTTLSIAVRTNFSSVQRAQAIAIYLVAFSLGMALGGVAWGHLAMATSLRIAIVVASIGLFLMALTVGHWISLTDSAEPESEGYYP
jgi:predicted MFS family arabinose efflux permease